MEPIYVIIDASSYINMSNIPYIRGTLLSVFAEMEEIVLRYSSTVNQEIERHCIPEEIDLTAFENEVVKKITNADDKMHILNLYHKSSINYVLKGHLKEEDRERIRGILNRVGYPYMSDSLERDAQAHRPKKYDHNEYEQRLFDEVAETTKNKGEKDNFAVALDLFIEEGKRNLIFLSDDDSAIKDGGCLSEVTHAFPIIKIWNSFDVVLLLYFLQKKDFPLEVAKDALKDLHKRTIPRDDPRMDRNKMKERQAKLNKYFKSLKRIQAFHRRGAYNE